MKEGTLNAFAHFQPPEDRPEGNSLPPTPHSPSSSSVKPKKTLNISASLGEPGLRAKKTPSLAQGLKKQKENPNWHFKLDMFVGSLEMAITPKAAPTDRLQAQVLTDCFQVILPANYLEGFTF